MLEGSSSISIPYKATKSTKDRPHLSESACMNAAMTCFEQAQNTKKKKKKDKSNKKQKKRNSRFRFPDALQISEILFMYSGVTITASE